MPFGVPVGADLFALAAAAPVFFEDPARGPAFFFFEGPAGSARFCSVRVKFDFHRHCAGVKTAGETKTDGGVGARARARACSSTGRRDGGVASTLDSLRTDMVAVAKRGSVPREPRPGWGCWVVGGRWLVVGGSQLSHQNPKVWIVIVTVPTRPAAQKKPCKVSPVAV